MLDYAEPVIQADTKAASERSMGYALTEMGRLEEAEAIYRQRLAKDPNDQKIIRRAGVCAKTTARATLITIET